MAKSNRYQRQDRFFKKAKNDKFVARSVYKLDELDRRYSLIAKNLTVVDLGCAPGSWLQYLAERVGRKGLVLGYDIVPIEMGLGPRVRTFVQDVHQMTAWSVLEEVEAFRAHLAQETPTPITAHQRPKVDALISDMAPKLTGIRDADQAKSVQLVGHALTLARGLLRPEKGVFVAKLFQGRDTDELVEEVKQGFRDVKLLKPEATREGSREVFVLGRTLRADGALTPTPPEDPTSAPDSPAA